MTEPEATPPALHFAHNTLAQALVAAQGEFGAVVAGTANTFFKSTYADLAAVKEPTQPILLKHGLAVTQEPSFLILNETPAKLVDTLRTVLIHESGEERESTMILRPVKNDPQGQGSAITYAKRYAYMAILGLVADKDDDGNAASGNTSKPASRPRAAAKPDPDAVDMAPITAAVAAIVASAKAAGASKKDVSEYYQAEFNSTFVGSRDLVSLNKTVEHYNALAAAATTLGATEVTA